VASGALSVWAYGIKACSQGPSTTTAEIHIPHYQVQFGLSDCHVAISAKHFDKHLENIGMKLCSPWLEN